MPEPFDTPDDDVVWLTIDEPQSPGSPTNSSYKLFLLVGLAVLVSLGAVGGVIWKLRDLAESRNRVITCVPKRSNSQLIRESTTAFSAFDAADDPLDDLSGTAREERVAIQAFFDKLETVVADDDLEAFRELVDHDKLLKRIELTGCLVGWSSLDKKYVRSELKDSVNMDSRWSDITIASVGAADGDPESRIVYAYCFDERNDEYSEHRLLISETDEGWKLYDWERLDLGLAESEEWSVYIKYSDNKMRDNFDQWGELIAEADALVIDNNTKAAKAKLESAELILVPSEVQDYCLVLTGYRWQSYGYDEEAKRCFSRVRYPERTPGAYFGLLILNRWDDPVQALANAEKYEATVGPTPELCQNKAQLLQRLNRKPEAIEAWKNLLRILPENTNALAGIHDALPADGKEEFDDYLIERNIPVTKVAEVANLIAYRDYPGFLHLLDYLTTHDASSARTIHLQGLAKELDGQNLAAAQFYKRAYETTEDESTQQSYASSYIQAMAAGGELIAGWKNSPDQIQAFETIVNLHGDGDIALSSEEYRQLVNLFRKEHPNELIGLLQAASIAFDAKEYDQVKELLRSSLARGNKQEAEDYLHTQRDYLLCSALFREKELEEAYAVSDDRSQRFAQLVALATQEDRWESIPDLLELHTANQPEDPMISFARGQLAAHEERWQEAINHYLQSLKKSDQEEPWLFTNRFREVCVESDRWRDYYGYSEDKSEAFYSLASDYIDEQDWDALSLLVYQHRRQDPEDPRLPQIEAISAWEREDYSTFVTWAKLALENEDSDALPQYRRYPLEQRLTSALLRTKDFFNARKRALAELREKKDGTSLAIVKAAEGELRDANELAIEVAKRTNSASTFYSNDDVGGIFLNHAFSKLHESEPVSLAFGGTPTLATFYSDEPWELDESTITAALKKLGIETPAKPEPIDVFGEATTKAFALRFRTGSIWIASGVGKRPVHGQLTNENHEFASLANDPKGWLAVGTAAWTELMRKQSEQLTRNLGVQLSGNRNAVMCLGADPWEPKLIYPTSKEIMEHWGRTGKITRFKKLGVPLEQHDPQQDVENDRLKRSQLFEAVRSFESEDKSNELELTVHLGNEIALDPVRVRVSKVNRSYGSLDLVGVLQDQSKLIPELRPGLRVAVQENEIDELRLLSGERKLAFKTLQNSALSSGR